MLNLHNNTIYSQFIDESQIKGTFTKEQRNNNLTIGDELTDSYTFEYVYVFWICRVLLGLWYQLTIEFRPERSLILNNVT
jgi:hypothetical protein